MTKIELDRLKALLAAKQIEVAQLLRKRDGIAIEKTSDALEEVNLSAERELHTRNLERESRLLREVQGALGRIIEGTYGSCRCCDKQISLKRLNAVPWASLCIVCQEHVERNCGKPVEQSEWFSANAA